MSNSITAMDVLLRAGYAALKRKALAVPETCEQSQLGSGNDAQASKERMSAASEFPPDRFLPWEYYEGAD